MMNKNNKFHEVTKSPWPILSSIQIYSIASQLTMNFWKKTSPSFNVLNLTSLILVSLKWWENTSKESNKEGYHNPKIMKMMKVSMSMFITSEIMFFLSFFWAYFHMSISPNIEVGQTWPPIYIQMFNPINVPLLNTIILISSGFSITWSHHLMLEKNLSKSYSMLMITCLLGFYFSSLQLMEYMQAQFSLSDSSCGTTFFIATGFHGMHVLVGTTFLLSNLMMMKNHLLSSTHHLGFELAAWYWHFVDVVWLFLYLSIYWWGM